MDTSGNQKNNNRFSCDICKTETNNKKDFNKHVLTRKHIKRGQQIQFETQKLEISPLLECSKCKKKYETRSGLWKHQKTCTLIDNKADNVIIGDSVNLQQPEAIQLHISETCSSNETKILANIILELIKSNNENHKQQTEMHKQTTELQKQLIDACKNTNNMNNNNMNINNNNNNKTFNLQFFLNEQCKDAMNISDFANSFDLQLSDLETVGELGYVEGITKIMVDKLNSMDIYKRPIHCSDAKREIIYVKDDNVWTKEEKDNPKLRQAIKNVSFKNMKLVYNWSNAYPESKDNQTKLNDKYMMLVIESTGGKGPILESENKIMRKIAKEIIIDKSMN
jgi:hypothetical protein